MRVRMEVDPKWRSTLHKLFKWADRVEKQAATNLWEQAQKVYLESQAEVPRDTGALAQSGFVRRRKFAVFVGYGEAGSNPRTGTATSKYVVKVHEDLEAKHPAGGKAKFLEDPLRRHLPKALDQLANSLRRVK